MYLHVPNRNLLIANLAVPIAAAAGLSPTAPLVSDVPASVVPPSGGGADILVADSSEGSEAVESASEAQVKASEDIHLSSVAAAASPANENAPPAQSRASHGSTVTYAADDEVDVKELSQDAGAGPSSGADCSPLPLTAAIDAAG